VNAKFVRLWLPAIFWSVFIFVLSSLPGADFAKTKGADFLIRKTLHVIEYSILVLTYYRGSKNAFVSAGLAVIFALTDELHQNLTPTRTGKVSDVLIDSIASLTTGFILWKLFPILPAKLKSWLLE